MASEALALQPSSDAAARRRHERLPTALEVHVNSTSEHNFYTGFTQNISEGGLFVATSNIQPIGSQLTFKFTLHPDPDEITVEGTVRWVREHSQFNESPAGMGVMFSAIDPLARARINDFIRRRRESIFFDDEDL